MAALTTRNGTALSRFAFGAMQFGGAADADASGDMYAAARAAGINFFDTAHAYTGGASERILGALVRAERDAVYIASKAAYEKGAGRDNILQSCDESRERLGVDQLDALYLHRHDPETPYEESFVALAELQSNGAIRHIGVSNFAAWQVVQANTVAKSLGTKIDLLQPMYNLVKRQAEVEILPMAADEGIAVVPYSPLGGGLLTGKYGLGGVGRLTENAQYRSRYGLDWMHEAAEGLFALATARGDHSATLACAWVAFNPLVFAPIVSARSAEQLAPSLAAIGFAMDDRLYAEISAVSLTPPPATDRLEEV